MNQIFEFQKKKIIGRGALEKDGGTRRQIQQRDMCVWVGIGIYIYKNGVVGGLVSSSGWWWFVCTHTERGRLCAFSVFTQDGKTP